jgi:asparagine synthase (glutamine-hydrolysing)
MCGIAGIVRFDGRQPDGDELARMTQALAHRGPDGHGTLLRDGVGLGHRRLSIIDLELGRQPMANEDQSVWVTFNGEIYNFRELKRELVSCGHTFRTDCDTEVIVHGYEQWGAACVERFRGMFAFAAVDFGRHTVLLARDHFGIKPLYYRLTDEYLAFASELGALRQTNHAPLRGSLTAIELFFRYQYIPTPHTIYRDVFKLPPASRIELNLDRANLRAQVRPQRYWNLAFGEGPAQSEAEWLDRVDSLVGEAVRESLVADVPFGVFLSGGVDSTLVAQKMRDVLGGEVKAFTIGFDEETYSEIPYAQQAARQIGLQWEHEIVRPDALAVLPELLQHYGEPYGDSSAIPTWYVCRLARQHVPMVLSGDGGDEAFGGYGSYRGWMETLESETLRRADRPAWKKGMLGLLGMLGYDHDRAVTYSLERWLQHIGYIDRSWRQRLWRQDLRGLVDAPCELFAAAAAEAPRCDPLSFVQYLDFQTYLPCDILTKVDVASMYHALEVRPSLLDVRLVELAAQMPVGLRMHRNGSPNLVPKYALKAALERHFSPAFVHRRKQGFAIPRDRWFLPGQPTRRRLEEIIREPGSRLGELLDREGMEALLASHSESSDASGSLWLLLVLGLWLEQNRDVSFA